MKNQSCCPTCAIRKSCPDRSRVYPCNHWRPQNWPPNSPREGRTRPTGKKAAPVRQTKNYA